MTPYSAAAGGSLRQPVEFAPRFLGGLLRHSGFVDLLAQLGDFGFGLARLAQLSLNRLELLAQVVLALRSCPSPPELRSAASCRARARRALSG